MGKTIRKHKAEPRGKGLKRTNRRRNRRQVKQALREMVRNAKGQG